MPRMHRVVHGPLSHLLLCWCAVRCSCLLLSCRSSVASVLVQSRRQATAHTSVWTVANNRNIKKSTHSMQMQQLLPRRLRRCSLHTPATTLLCRSFNALQSLCWTSKDC